MNIAIISDSTPFCTYIADKPFPRPAPTLRQAAYELVDCLREISDDLMGAALCDSGQFRDGRPDQFPGGAA